MKQTRNSLRRVNTGKTGEVAQTRYTVYGFVWARISQAKSHGFWLECIALCESIIADRLEAMWAQLHQQSANARNVRTAKQTASLLKRRPGLEPEVNELCQVICEWSDARNIALHEMTKILEGDNRSIEQKVKELNGINIQYL